MPKPKATPPAAPAPQVPPAPPPAPAPAPVPAMPMPPAPASPVHTHKSLLIAVIGLLVIAAGGGATAFFFLGGDSSTPPTTDTPPVVEQPATPQAPAWTDVGSPDLVSRKYMGVVSHGDSLMVVGGLQGDDSPVKDVVAYDGVTWMKKGAFPVSISRASLVSVDGTLWSFGGVSPALDPTNTNAIYSSKDGVTWSKKGSLPGTRFQSPIVANGGVLWSLGGRYIDPATKGIALSKRVFSSKNGTSWDEVGDNALPAGIAGASVVSFNGTVWMIGGGALDADKNVMPGTVTYSSSDGKTWTPGANAPQAMADACGVVWNDKVWVIGGMTTGGPSAAVYSTTDGVIWNTEAALPQPVAAPGCAVYRGALFVVGGGAAYRMGEMTMPTAPATGGTGAVVTPPAA